MIYSLLASKMKLIKLRQSCRSGFSCQTIQVACLRQKWPPDVAAWCHQHTPGAYRDTSSSFIIELNTTCFIASSNPQACWGAWQYRKTPLLPKMWNSLIVICHIVFPIDSENQGISHPKNIKNVFPKRTLLAVQKKHLTAPGWSTPPPRARLDGRSTWDWWCL